MTNFEPLKDKIWNAVVKADRVKFDKQCDNLMKKACGDWWRIGWNIAPNDTDELVKMFQQIAKCAHKEWLKVMRRGDAPPEDVSPGEGFALCAKLIQDLQKELKATKKKCR